MSNKDSMWKLLTAISFVLLVVVLLGARSDAALGTCIYEAIYDGAEQKLIVGWTHPPCSSSVSIMNPVEHEQMIHSAATTQCGKTVIYSEPQLDAPVADTFGILCIQKRAQKVIE